MATPDKIKQTTKRMLELVDTLVRTNAMVKGSLSTVHRRCGKPTCWCADPTQKGHACTRITWTEDGVAHTRTVKQEDFIRLREATQTYRTYRNLRRQLRAEEQALEDMLDRHEKEIITDL
jgi:hypothetical protein